MNTKKDVMRAFLVIFCCMFWAIISAEPVVSNVQASQRPDGSMIIDISYDLASTGSEKPLIMVEVSPDGGATWRVPLKMTGDIGPDIEAGTNRQIVWDAGEEAPDEYWLNCLVKITAREPITIMLKWGVPMELMKISAGSYMMGRYPAEQDSLYTEDARHEVKIAYDFYLGKYPVTKVQWEAMMGTTPWDGQHYVLDDPESPATHVSWNDIRETNGFLDKLNAHLVSTEQPYEVRLPSEAEWEYAVRAGTTTRFYWGDDPDYTEIDNYAWYGYWFGIGNTEGGYVHIVGQKLPNAWGLYDMSGNVWEWCEDDWHLDYNGAPADGSAWVDSPRGLSRVRRGGSWEIEPGLCRSASRRHSDPTYRVNSFSFRVLAVRK